MLQSIVQYMSIFHLDSLCLKCLLEKSKINFSARAKSPPPHCAGTRVKRWGEYEAGGIGKENDVDWMQFKFRRQDVEHCNNF